MVILHRAFDQAELEADLALGTAGGALQLKRPESDRRLVGANQEISKLESEGTDQGFRSLRGFGVEDFQCEDGVSGVKGERQNEPFVPYGSGRTRIVRLRGLASFRFDPQDHVGFEIAIPPVDVLQVFSGDDCYIQIVELRRRPRGGAGGHE